MTLVCLQASPGHAQQQNDWIILGRQFRCQMNMAAATICHQPSKAAPGAVIGQAIFGQLLDPFEVVAPCFGRVSPNSRIGQPDCQLLPNTQICGVPITCHTMHRW